jgi:hypothetical protein
LAVPETTGAVDLGQPEWMGHRRSPQTRAEAAAWPPPRYAGNSAHIRLNVSLT